MGFTIGSRREGDAMSSDGELENQESATPCTSTMEQPHNHVAAQLAQHHVEQATTTITPIAIAEIRMPQEKAILSLVSKTLDAFIQSNVNAGVIASKEFVAEEVWRQEKQHHREVNGTGGVRER